MYKLISHRGIVNKNIKENSYDSIKKALDSKEYLGVEFDVRETLDNEFILYHDSLYNNKLISKTKYNELPKYVPRLKDILKINSNKIFLIEIKSINNYNKFISVVNENCDKKIYIMSFSNKVIEKINKDNRCYKIGILNYILNTSELTKKLDFVGILNSLLSDDLINKLQGIEIFSYGLFEKKKYDNVFYIVDNKKD